MSGEYAESNIISYLKNAKIGEYAERIARGALDLYLYINVGVPGDTTLRGDVDDLAAICRVLEEFTFIKESEAPPFDIQFTAWEDELAEVSQSLHLPLVEKDIEIIKSRLINIARAVIEAEFLLKLKLGIKIEECLVQCSNCNKVYRKSMYFSYCTKCGCNLEEAQQN